MVPTTEKKVLYVDVFLGGHHITYSKNIISELFKKSAKVDILTLNTAYQSEGYRDFVLSLPGGARVFDIVDIDAIDKRLPNPIKYWLALRSSLRKLKGVSGTNYDVIFISDISNLFKAFGLLGSPFGGVSIVALLISSRLQLNSSHWSRSARLKRFIEEKLFFNLLRNNKVTRIITIDNTLANNTNLWRNRSAEKLRLLEVPFTVSCSSDSTLARKQLGACKGSLIVLVFGALSHRKAVDSIIDAAASNRLNGRVTVLLVGVADDDIRETLNTPTSNELRKRGLLLEFLRYVSDTEEDEYFAAADIVWVAYRDFYDTSGVLLSAYAHSKPVIGCDKGHIASCVRKDKTGYVVNPDDREAIISKLQILSASPEKRMVLGRRAGEIAQRRKPEAFFAKVVEEILGDDDHAI